MQLFKKGLLAATAALVLYSATVSAAADPEAQLDTIADDREVWKYEFPALCAPGEVPVHRHSFVPRTTLIAVTDLDGNGRLELLFRHVDYLKWKVGSVPYAFHQIPTAVAMAVYEVGADGRLTRLPVPEDGYGAPDFMGLDASHPISEDGVLWYPMCTKQMDRDDHGHFHYTTTYRRIAIKDGRVKIHVLAEESGYYNVYDIDRVEQVATSANIYDGNPAHEKMRPEDFWQTAFYQKFHRNYAPNSIAHWISGSELNVDPRKALLASWQGFVYRSMNGKG